MKKLLPFLALLGILVALLLYLNKEDRNSSMDDELVDFSIADTSKVDRIFIADNRGFQADLVRQDSGWVVNGKYLVTQDGINVLLKTFKLVYIKSPVPKSAQENTLRVMSSTSKRVEIFTGDDEPEKVWHVGHPTQDHFGTYMVLETSAGRGKEPFITSMQGFAGHLASRFFADERDWRRTEIFRYAPGDIRSVNVDLPRQPDRGFELRSDGENRFELSALDGREIGAFDTLAAKDLLINFRRVNYEMYAKGVDQAMADSIGSTTPLMQMKVTDKNGRSNAIDVFYKLAKPELPDDQMADLLEDVDRMLVRLNNGDMVIAQRFNLDRVTVDLAYFRPEFAD